MSQHVSSPASSNDQERKRFENTLLSMSYNAEFSRRSAIKAMFALAGAAVLFGRPTRALATPSASKETLDALADAEKQVDQVQAQLTQIGKEFQALSIEQDKTLTQIEKVQGKIDDTQDEIEKKQRQLATKQDELSARVSSSYKNGPASALSLLLSSGSFEELISNAHYVEKINDNDKRAIADIRDIQQELENQKAQLEQQKADLEKLKDEQAARLKDMQAKQDEVQTLLSGLSEDVKELMAKRDAEILAAAQEEERQRKAAEEAARQQQLLQQQQQQRPSGGGTTYIPGNGQTSGSAGGGQQAIVAACRSTPSPGAGLCAMWVSQVFARAGYRYVGGNANDMYNAYCTSSSKADLKVGMIVAVSTYSRDYLGAIYGHVGIYIGDNTVMENIGSVATTNLDEWISYYGTTVTPRWGWLGGIKLA